MTEIKFKAVLSNFYDSGVYWGYVNVPIELAEKVKGKERRVVCTLSDEVEFHCALMHDGKGGFFVNIKKEYQKKLGVLEGDELKLVCPQLDFPPEQFEDLNFKHFYVQPMDGKELQKNILECVAYCVENPLWKLSLQTHKIIGIK